MANDLTQTFEEATISGVKFIIEVNLDDNKINSIMLESGLDFGTYFAEKSLFFAKDAVETLRKSIDRAFTICGLTAPYDVAITDVPGMIQIIAGIEREEGNFKRQTANGTFYHVSVNRDTDDIQVNYVRLTNKTDVGNDFKDKSIHACFENAVNLQHVIQQAYTETATAFDGWADLNPEPAP